MRITVRWVTLVVLFVVAAPAGAEPVIAMGTGEGPPAAVPTPPARCTRCGARTPGPVRTR